MSCTKQKNQTYSSTYFYVRSHTIGEIWSKSYTISRGTYSTGSEENKGCEPGGSKSQTNINLNFLREVVIGESNKIEEKTEKLTLGRRVYATVGTIKETVARTMHQETSTLATTEFFYVKTLKSKTKTRIWTATGGKRQTGSGNKDTEWTASFYTTNADIEIISHGEVVSKEVKRLSTTTLNKKLIDWGKYDTHFSIQTQSLGLSRSYNISNEGYINLGPHTIGGVVYVADQTFNKIEELKKDITQINFEKISSYTNSFILKYKDDEDFVDIPLVKSKNLFISNDKTYIDEIYTVKWNVPEKTIALPGNIYETFINDGSFKYVLDTKNNSLIPVPPSFSKVKTISYRTSKNEEGTLTLQEKNEGTILLGETKKLTSTRPTITKGQNRVNTITYDFNIYSATTYQFDAIIDVLPLSTYRNAFKTEEEPCSNAGETKIILSNYGKTRAGTRIKFYTIVDYNNSNYRIYAPFGVVDGDGQIDKVGAYYGGNRKYSIAVGGYDYLPFVGQTNLSSILPYTFAAIGKNGEKPSVCQTCPGGFSSPATISLSHLNYTYSATWTEKSGSGSKQITVVKETSEKLKLNLEGQGFVEQISRYNGKRNALVVGGNFNEKESAILQLFKGAYVSYLQTNSKNKKTFTTTGKFQFLGEKKGFSAISVYENVPFFSENVGNGNSNYITWTAARNYDEYAQGAPVIVSWRVPVKSEDQYKKEEYVTNSATRSVSCKTTTCCDEPPPPPPPSPEPPSPPSPPSPPPTPPADSCDLCCASKGFRSPGDSTKTICESLGKEYYILDDEIVCEGVGVDETDLICECADCRPYTDANNCIDCCQKQGYQPSQIYGGPSGEDLCTNADQAWKEVNATCYGEGLITGFTYFDCKCIDCVPTPPPPPPGGSVCGDCCLAAGFCFENNETAGSCKDACEKEGLDSGVVTVSCPYIEVDPETGEETSKIYPCPCIDCVDPCEFCCESTGAVIDSEGTSLNCDQKNPSETLVFFDHTCETPEGLKRPCRCARCEAPPDCSQCCADADGVIAGQDSTLSCYDNPDLLRYFTISCEGILCECAGCLRYSDCNDCCSIAGLGFGDAAISECGGAGKFKFVDVDCNPYYNAPPDGVKDCTCVECLPPPPPPPGSCDACCQSLGKVLSTESSKESCRNQGKDYRVSTVSCPPPNEIAGCQCLECIPESTDCTDCCADGGYSYGSAEEAECLNRGGSITRYAYACNPSPPAFCNCFQCSVSDCEECCDTIGLAGFGPAAEARCKNAGFSYREELLDCPPVGDNNFCACVRCFIECSDCCEKNGLVEDTDATRANCQSQGQDYRSSTQVCSGELIPPTSCNCLECVPQNLDCGSCCASEGFGYGSSAIEYCKENGGGHTDRVIPCDNGEFCNCVECLNEVDCSDCCASNGGLGFGDAGKTACAQKQLSWKFKSTDCGPEIDWDLPCECIECTDEGTWRITSFTAGTTGSPTCVTTASLSFSSTCLEGSAGDIARANMSGTFQTSCPKNNPDGTPNPCFGKKPSGTWSDVVDQGSTTESATFGYEDCPGLEGDSSIDYLIQVFLEPCTPDL